MKKDVTILTGEPTIAVIAEMRLDWSGVKEMADWVEEHRPECLPEDWGSQPLPALFPHNMLRSESAVDISEKDHLSSNELLVELAGRKCYDSFGLKAGRKSNAEYIAHTQSGEIPHACYDAQTEVLTADGWKTWEEVTAEDLFASRTLEGQLVYERPIALTATRYTGRMYRVEGGAVDLSVTPNHRMYVCLTSTRQGRNRENFEFVTAENLDTLSHCYVKDAAWKQGKPSTPYMRAILALLGFAIGDGTMGSASDYDHSLRFHLKKTRKISWLRATVARIGWELREQARDAYVVPIPEDMRSLFRAIYDEYREKQIPPGVLLEWDRDALEALLDGLIQSDGHISPTNVSYSSASLRLLDQVQQLALHVGQVAHVRLTEKQCAHVSFIRRNVRPEVNRGAVLPRTRWENYSGMVYCAQVPSGTLFVRRNGIPVWCGNSILYHAKMSFFFAGISRRVSHELIRNYVGADRSEEGAPSQESTRFTHHYGFFILPPRYLEQDGSIEGVGGTHERKDRFTFAMKEAYEHYLKMVALEVEMYEAKHGDPPKGTDRKRIYEAASSLLPHQAETSFIWTTNPAAIAKLVKERAGEAADLEMQRFAKKLRRVCVERWPNLFPPSQTWMHAP